ALGAYLWWGFVPLYFHALSHVEPIQVLGHRVIWSFVLLMLLTWAMSGWNELRAATRQRRTMLMLMASTLAVSVNWFTFIVAVEGGKVIDSSLGYFINPLVSVVLGMIFLRERLRPAQAVGLMLATAGVIYMTWTRRQVPSIALILAVSFGLYGLLRKIAPVRAMPGLTIETAFLLIPAIVVVSLHRLAAGAMPYDTTTRVLLGTAGFITAIPLLMFAAGARRLRLSTMGFLQYIGPTCQFLLAIFVFREPFKADDLLSFGLIWLALVVYSVDSYRAYRRIPAPIPINSSPAEA
ncbi:MAG TPA: EamA family transporter RarD, partial [Tepidisphaeraceae bacterium]